MNPVDIKSNTYINSSKEINDQDPEFKIGDIIRISKYKNIFAKSSIQNWSDFFIIKVVKNTCHGHVVSDLKGKKIAGTFYEIELQRTNQKNLDLKKY